MLYRAHSERKKFLTPLHRDRALQAGVLHLAGVDLSPLRSHLQHDQDLEGPVPILNKLCGHDPHSLLLAIPEPAHIDPGWIEICHGADQQVVMVEGLRPGQGDGDLGLL